MGGISDKGLFEAGPWSLGINNLDEEDKQPVDENGARLSLREADNVDLTRQGWPRRRNGYELAMPGLLTHSIWGHDELLFGLFVDDGFLCTMDTAEEVDSLGIEVGSLPVSYELINDKIFFTNRNYCGMVTLSGEAKSWAPEHPNGQPHCTATTGYSLEAGKYQVAITIEGADGRESGTTRAVQVQVEANGAIELSHIPVPAAGAVVNVYATGPNDQVLRLHHQLAGGLTTSIIAQKAKGRPCVTQGLVAMPPGEIVRGLNGRQYVVNGRVIRWSPPHRQGMTDMARNALVMKDDVDMFEPVGAGGAGAGVFVGSGGKTYFFAGPDPMKWSKRVVASAGVVRGSSTLVEANAFGGDSKALVPVWVSRDGHFCRGDEGGLVTRFKEGEAVIDGAARAATLFRKENGIQQLVTTLQQPKASGFAVSDRLVGHVIHADP